MSLFATSKRETALARIAPITEKAGTDRRMRAAILHAKRKGPAATEFAQQQAFDRAVARRVRDIPVSAEISEWFRNEKLIPAAKRGWRKTLRNPVILSIALALFVILGVGVYVVIERMNEFPGSGTARKLLTIASSMRGVPMDAVTAETGSLNDFFFMKYRLEHYNVPPEFAGLRSSAVRVFDDDEGRRVAQITVADKRLQLFFFPAERNLQTGQPIEFSGWRYVENENWTGAVRVRDGVYFMAAVRGPRKELAPYLAKHSAAAEPASSPR
ncbi:MAG: hypothetical protein ABI992_12980 [Chthoniobacterales bacterium]